MRPMARTAAPRALNTKKEKPSYVRETITYPLTNMTPGTDSCNIPSSHYEHVLLCKHLVVTSTPDEKCAPNCHHVAKSKSEKPEKTRISENKFYCDACVEIEIEGKIPSNCSAGAAEDLRTKLRIAEAEKRDRESAMWRKCYIGCKVTSVPCDAETGRVSRDYVPKDGAHPFDTAIPRTGQNFFEGIDACSPKSLASVKKLDAAAESGTGTGTDTDTDSENSIQNLEDVMLDEDVDETVVEGQACLEERNIIARYRSQEDYSRARRIAARPVVASSSQTEGTEDQDTPYEETSSEEVDLSDEGTGEEEEEEEEVVVEQPKKRKYTVPVARMPARKKTVRPCISSGDRIALANEGWERCSMFENSMARKRRR